MRKTCGNLGLGPFEPEYDVAFSRDLEDGAQGKGGCGGRGFECSRNDKTQAHWYA